MRTLLLISLITLVVAACRSGDSGTTIYDVRGRVVSEQYGGLALRIDHEEIPGHMEAMRMSFRLASPEEGRRVQPGDAISFEYVVTSNGGVIRNIRLLPVETTLDLPHLDADTTTVVDQEGVRR